MLTFLNQTTPRPQTGVNSKLMKKQLQYFIICFIATIFVLLMIFYTVGGIVNQNLLEQLFNDTITMVALVIGVGVLSIIAAKIDTE